MNLKKVLTKNCISLHLKSDTKQGIISEMLDILVATGNVKNREEALEALLERERKMSTGMQHGVAIPHAKTNTVDGLVAAVAIKKEGIDFESLDKELSNIFVMTLSPLNRTGPHIQFLSEISQLLNKPELRRRILEAETVEQVLAVISG